MSFRSGERVCVVPMVAMECFLAFSIMLGCSVKEDRTECPVVLVLDTETTAEEVESLLLHVISGDTALVRDSLEAPLEDEYRYVLPQGVVHVSALYPSDTEVSGLGAVEISYGEQCPPIWAWHEDVSLKGELVRDSVVMHKEYCLLSIKLVASDTALPYPFDLAVKGNWRGLEAGGEPMSGDFYVELNPSSSDDWSQLRLPRQNDSSLMLEVLSSEGSLRSFAIGEYIAASGYDWTATDLEDLSMQLDFAATTVSLSYGNWSQTLSFEIWI